LSDDDDDDDMNAAGADNTSESDYRISDYRHQHLNGFADHHVTSHWHSSRNNYTTAAEVSGNYSMIHGT